MKLDAMKRQGQRTDLTSTPLAGKLKSAGIIGEAAGRPSKENSAPVGQNF